MRVEKAGTTHAAPIRGDPSITAEAYSDIFEPEDAFQRVRECQARVLLTEKRGQTNGARPRSRDLIRLGSRYSAY